MDNFATRNADERRRFFEEAAARDGRMAAQLIEKDFWVCWTLRRMFALADIGDHLTFKGGTSLSKVYDVIERFSEDVDLSIERSFLGFGGENEPERGTSGKEQQRRIASLKEACQTVIAERILPLLQEGIAKQLGDNGDWHLSFDEDDTDRQSLQFRFPPAIGDGLSPYFAQSIKIEMGARSDHFPVEKASVCPYVAEQIPDLFDEIDATVRVLDAQRTFWEKATILHAEFHRPREKPLAKRQSRHYYDLVQLAEHSIGKEAIGNTDLLARVAQHKSIFYKSGWANYADARPGTIRLVPPPERFAELNSDYADMEPMFFGNPPPFESIVERLRNLENMINNT